MCKFILPKGVTRKAMVEKMIDWMVHKLYP